MPSKQIKITVTVNSQVLRAAKKNLAKHGLTVSEYLNQCLVWSVKCPKHFARCIKRWKQTQS